MQLSLKDTSAVVHKGRDEEGLKEMERRLDRLEGIADGEPIGESAS